MKLKLLAVHNGQSVLAADDFQLEQLQAARRYDERRRNPRSKLPQLTPRQLGCN